MFSADLPKLTAQAELDLSQNVWNIEKQDGLAEGSGMFTTQQIPAGQKICHYGGDLLCEQQAEQLVEDGKSDYLIEFTVGNVTCFLNNPTSQDGLGGYLNHSSKHPNVYPKFFFNTQGNPDIVFISKKKIPAGIELVWDYGPAYQGVRKCVTSCDKCGEF